jgi:hypothetical protein
MRLEHAAVVCFRDDGVVEIREADLSVLDGENVD